MKHHVEQQSKLRLHFSGVVASVRHLFCRHSDKISLLNKYALDGLKKLGLTSNGRVLTWEVSLTFHICFNMGSEFNIPYMF